MSKKKELKFIEDSSHTLYRVYCSGEVNGWLGKDGSVTEVDGDAKEFSTPQLARRAANEDKGQRTVMHNARGWWKL